MYCQFLLHYFYRNILIHTLVIFVICLFNVLIFCCPNIVKVLWSSSNWWWMMNISNTDDQDDSLIPPLSDDVLMSRKDNNNLARRNLYGIIQSKLRKYSQGFSYKICSWFPSPLWHQHRGKYLKEYIFLYFEIWQEFDEL